MPRKKAQYTQMRYKRDYARKRRTTTEPNTSLTVNKRQNTAMSSHNIAVHSLSDYAELSLPEYTSIGNMKYHCKSCKADMWKGETHSGELGISASFFNMMYARKSTASCD